MSVLDELIAENAARRRRAREALAAFDDELLPITHPDAAAERDAQARADEEERERLRRLGVKFADPDPDEPEEDPDDA